MAVRRLTVVKKKINMTCLMARARILSRGPTNTASMWDKL
jgi:hypothetical protein